MHCEADCGSMISKRASTPVRAVIVRKPGLGYGVGFHCSPRKGQKPRFIDRISFRISISHHVDHILHTCYYAIVVEPSPDFRPISNPAGFRSRLTRGHQHCLFVLGGSALQGTGTEWCISMCCFCAFPRSIRVVLIQRGKIYRIFQREISSESRLDKAILLCLLFFHGKCGCSGPKRLQRTRDNRWSMRWRDSRSWKGGIHFKGSEVEWKLKIGNWKRKKGSSYRWIHSPGSLLTSPFLHNSNSSMTRIRPRPREGPRGLGGRLKTI